MILINIKNIFFLHAVSSSLNKCKNILDIGCGPNSSIREVLKRFDSEGIDIHKASIDLAKKNKTHNRYTIGDIRQIEKFYKPKCFDAVIAIDVIEHLVKKDTLKLLDKMEKIARKEVIVLTPNGFCHLDHYDNNPYQTHKSGWTKKDLEACGYKVYGLLGLKYIRGEFATIKFKPWIVWGFISFITEPILYYFPSLSFSLFAVKDVS